MEPSETKRALSFGADAAAYDAHRPSYPAPLFDELFPAMDSTSVRVVEVGAGTGQATRDLAARAASVVALEPDERLATILKAKNLPNVDVLVSSFERWDGSDQQFGIVASAQAWHWVDAEVGVAKAARVLLKDGLLALWWNMPLSDRTAGSRLLDGVYEALAPELLNSSVMVRAKSDGRHTRRVEESPAFDRPYEVAYEWSQEYTADAYVALLATHSDHQAMPPDRRERLLDAVHGEVARMGTIEFRYVTECLIARRL